MQGHKRLRRKNLLVLHQALLVDLFIRIVQTKVYLTELGSTLSIYLYTVYNYQQRRMNTSSGTVRIAVLYTLSVRKISYLT